MSHPLQIQETQQQRYASISIHQCSATQALLNRKSTERPSQGSERTTLLGGSKTQIQRIDEDLARTGSGLVTRHGFIYRTPVCGNALRVLEHAAPSWVLHRTCYGHLSVLTMYCDGPKPVRRQTQVCQLWRANMPSPQLELWSAEPHLPPPLYQALTPQQRSQLVHHLAQLILKRVQVVRPNSLPPSTPIPPHERPS